MWLCGGTGRCLAFLVERFSSNQAVSDDLSRQPQEKKLCEPIIFYSVKSAPFYAVSSQRWVVSNFGAFGNLLNRPSPLGEGVPHIAKNPYTAACPNVP